MLLPPTIPSSGAVQASSVSTNSVTISWSPASDDTTPTDQLVYEVRYAPSSVDLSTVASAEANGTSAGAPAPAITSKVVSGLQPGTEYGFAVLVRDNDLTKSIYTKVTESTKMVVDTVPPTAIDRVISTTSVGETTIDIAWSPATDDVTSAELIAYDIYKPTGTLPINTLPRVATNGTLLATVTGVTAYQMTGLDVGATYPIVVVARDQAGNKTIYRAVSVSTRSAELVAHYGQFVRMGTGNQFFYIDQEGEKMYKVLSNLVAHTWQSVGTIESLSRASIRQMSLEEEYILPKPGTMMIYVSGVYYWLEANGTDVGHPIARPFANDAIIASIFGAKWRTYVIQLSASDVIGAQAGEIIDQATDITVNVAGMKTLKQYRAELKN